MNLDQIRNEIDHLDAILLDAFLKRLNYANKVAIYKEEHNLPILNANREKEILEYVKSVSKDQAPWAVDFYQRIFEISRNYQIHCQEHKNND